MFWLASTHPRIYRGDERIVGRSRPTLNFKSKTLVI
jgi:hypothetical protein